MRNRQGKRSGGGAGSSGNAEITAHRDAEAALRASEARFRTFVDHAIDAFLLFDEQLVIVDLNRQACEGLGYSRSELIGMHPRDFDVALGEGSIDQLRQRTAAGETITFETQHRRKDGTIFPVEIRARQFEQDGRSFVLSLVRDITERKRAEQERVEHVWFLESLDRINRATQGAKDLETMIKQVLAVVHEIFACDRAWLHDCGATPSARVVVELSRPEYPGPAALGIQEEMPAEIVAEIALARMLPGVITYGPGGRRPLPPQVAERWGIRSQMLIFINLTINEPYVFGLHQCSYARVWTAQEQRLFEEIARRVAAALTSQLILRSLRESEHRLDAAQRIAHVGYWDRDLDTGRTTLSDEACRIFGLPTDERVMDLTQWHDRWLALIHPQDRPRIAEAADAALNGGPAYDVEYHVTRPGGDVRIIHSRGEVNRDGSGQPRRLFGMMQDITELRRAEEERRRAEGALQVAQAELTHLMRVMTLGELAASIAHEVNQPLGAMVTSAAACKRWLSLEPPDMIRAGRALERIVNDGKRASAVIDRIRALTKRQAPRYEWLDINSLLREVLALTQYELRRNEIVVEKRLTEGLPPLHGDKVQLQQVLLNLIINAIEAMKGVADRRRILTILSLMEGGEAVRVEVHDSGIGLDPETAKRLFEPFYSTKVNGIGIGLSISFSIVEAHGGRLSAAAGVPHGAVFRLSLPLDDLAPDSLPRA